MMQQIRDYVNQKMGIKIAHDFEHSRRVALWALRIAKEEGYNDLKLVETAALMHDIGHAETNNAKIHGKVGAKMAREFLVTNKLFHPRDIQKIYNAIKYHNKNREGRGRLLDIIRDADALDLFGAIGIMRAITSRHGNEMYNLINIKGDAWNRGNKYFDKKFDRGGGVGEYIIDQINFQISCYDNLITSTAKVIAKPLVVYMKKYVEQAELEVQYESKI